MTSRTLATQLWMGQAAPTVAVALASVCFGLVPLFARELQALGIASPAIALYRFASSAAILAPFLPVSRGKRRDALIVGGAGLLAGAGWVGYLEAVKVVPVAAAGVIYMSYPLFAALFAWLLVGLRPGPRALGAGLLVLGAAAVLLDPSALPADGPAALIWSLPAPMTFGLLIVVLSCLAGRLDAAERLACAMTGASIGLAPVVLWIDADRIMPASVDGWGLVAGLALSTALVPQFLYTLACPRVGPARSAAAGSFELPTMFAVGWLAFGEAVGAREAVSAMLVLSAILIAPAVRPPR